MNILRHAMIDLETLDLVPSARIVSIGIVMFDPRFNAVGDKYYVELDHKAQINRTKDPKTVKWWKQQPPAVQKALKGTELLQDALEDIMFFLPEDVMVWGNGSIFDIAIMEHAYREHELEIPWKFWNVMDMRTIKYFYESQRGGWDKKCGGDKHNALDDAYHQAQSVSAMWRKLVKS